MSNEAELRKRIEELERQLAAAQQKPANVDATQSGSGTVATHGGVGAGERGMAIGGDFHGNVYIGEKPDTEEEALRIYRGVFAASCRQLPLRGVDLSGSDPSSQKIDLDQVYIELDTTSTFDPEQRQIIIESQTNRSSTEESDEQKKLSALQAAAVNRRLVLLGGPGSGKSTFLNHLGLCLALHSMEPDGAWLSRLSVWPAAEGELLPVSVVLRDYGAHHAKTTAAATPKHLWNFVLAQLHEQNLDFAGDLLFERLDTGGVLMIMDGLDEIPTAQQRTFVRDSVAAFAQRHPMSRMLVTCRTLSYQDPAWQLHDFQQATLAAFDDAQIGRFIEGWYRELERLQVVRSAEVASSTQRLQEAVNRPELRELAQTPLLLTVMALVHTHEGRLPDARALLYERTIEILLWRWEEIKVGQATNAPTLRRMLQDVNRTGVDLKRTLWRLAFDAHSQTVTDGESGLADIGELTLQNALAELHPERSRDWAYSLIQAIKMRAGLLLERTPGVYTFPHRTFQEYLAGAHLASGHEFARVATALTGQSAFWRQVILLAVGRLVYEVGDFEKPISLAGELAPAQTPQRMREQDDGALIWRRIWLAGEVLQEVGVNRVADSNLGQIVLQTTRQRLLDLIAAGALTPIERAEAGTVLARLGDPRFNGDFWHLPTDPMLGFIEIPSGTFLMGSDPKVDKQSTGSIGKREQPRYEQSVDRFLISRYQVTVAQWRAYCRASGHESYERSLRDPANNPVRYVEWTEAMDYCQWLTARLREDERTPQPLATLLREGDGDGRPWQITLPSEAQWERAARGTDGRIYPWGNEFDAERCNVRETGIGQPGPVGLFANGASPDGCLDMAGNLYDWTTSKLLDYPYKAQDGREDLGDTGAARVVRGGSFVSGFHDARCAFRDISVRRSSLVGFRLVVAPFPLNSE